MAAAPKTTSRNSTIAVVVPKMEYPPEYPPTLGSSELKRVKEAPNNDNIVHGGQSVDVSIPDVSAVNDEIASSEMQLVASLAKLQKIEAIIHQLRSLLPERLLEPLAPIVNPKAAAGISVPSSPRKLYEQLSQAARSGVAEVTEFQNMWRSPEMKDVWDRVDVDIKDNNGQLLQPTGVWEQDYDTILEELVKQDQTKKDAELRAKEDLERSRIQSAEGGWKTVLEQFSQKCAPGVRILPNNESSFFILLGKAGLAFKIQAIDTVQGNGVPEWQVSHKPTSGQPVSKLENAVLACLNTRARKWDLSYLLDMVSSYSNLKQTPCIKCGKMTDNATNLPGLRRLIHTESPDESQPVTWGAYHTSCA